MQSTTCRWAGDNQAPIISSAPPVSPLPGLRPSFPAPFSPSVYSRYMTAVGDYHCLLTACCVLEGYKEKTPRAVLGGGAAAAAEMAGGDQRTLPRFLCRGNVTPVFHANRRRLTALSG